MVLDQFGGECLVYTLRGFLFFGTANAILDTIRDDAKVRSAHYRVILLDLKRVTGMDISALNTFVQIKTICEISGVQLVYSGVESELRNSLLMMDAVSREADQPLVFPMPITRWNTWKTCCSRSTRVSRERNLSRTICGVFLLMRKKSRS